MDTPRRPDELDGGLGGEEDWPAAGKDLPYTSPEQTIQLWQSPYISQTRLLRPISDTTPRLRTVALPLVRNRHVASSLGESHPVCESNLCFASRYVRETLLEAVRDGFEMSCA